MKKIICVILSLIFVTMAAVPAGASSESQVIPTTSVEYLDDGSYFIIETTQIPTVARSTSKVTSGSKTATHYGANGTAIWRVTVHGTFSYIPVVSAKATSASATVELIDKNTTFVEKDAYISGASAYAYGKIKYDGTPYSKTVILTCDTNGSLS